MSRKIILEPIILLVLCSYAYTQTRVSDSTINNLVHTPGYKAELNRALPDFIKTGKGKQNMILIPGLGFDASIFNDFTRANEIRYTMYVITVPGYGSTSAPPMPETTISYGEQTWNKTIVASLIRLINTKNISKPVILGHFVQGVQLAIQLAVALPEKVAGLILMGGPVKFIQTSKGNVVDYPLDKMIMIVDTYTAPVWFKHMDKTFFDNNNFAPEIYSLDSATGTSMRRLVEKVPLPVAVRYSCEYFASDIRTEFDKIKCPVVVLRPLFNDKVLQKPTNNYLKPNFINSWDTASKINPLIRVVDLPNTAYLPWKDNPKAVYEQIHSFMGKIEN